MFDAIIGILAIILYSLCGALLLYRLLRRPALAKSGILGLSLIAILLHGLVLYHTTEHGLDVSFFKILSLVGWLAALLLVLTAFRQPVENLGIVALPFSALTLLLQLLLPGSQPLGQELAPTLELHILISILAYCLLSIAAVQAILLYIQDRHLHNKHPGGFIRTLPALETMEQLLFRMIGLGFLMLGVALLTGFIYLDDLFAQHLVHKTVLSIIAWLLFGTLLWGRWRFGWRGRTAIRWTLSGFIFLMLAYFGSKMVIELILQRV